MKIKKRWARLPCFAAHRFNLALACGVELSGGWGGGVLGQISARVISHLSSGCKNNYCTISPRYGWSRRINRSHSIYHLQSPRGCPRLSTQTRIVRGCSPLGMPAQQSMKFGQHERSVFIRAEANVCSEFSHIKQAQTCRGLVSTIQTWHQFTKLLILTR
jgi:hypothetical protein